MPPTDPRKARSFSLLLLLGGAVVVLVTTAADALGLGGSPGFGWKEGAAVAVGVALMAAGALLPSPLRRSLTRRWAGARTLTPGACIVLSLWFGLLTGVIEVGHWALRKRFSERILPSPDEFLWLIPACYAVSFAVLGVLLALSLRLWPRLVRFPIALFFFTVFAVWTQLLVHPSLDVFAVSVLAVGMGWQIARFGAKRADGLLRLTRWSTPAMAALVVLVALGMPVARDIVEARANSNLPPARQGAPNVLLIVLDTVRADHLEPYGYGRETSPALDELAAQGVVFEWAMSTSSWTVPAHASMFTGRYTHEIQSEGYRDWLDDRFPTLAEIFTERGYATAGFVGNISRCCRDRGFARGFTHYEDYYVTPEVVLLATSLGQMLVGDGPHRPRVRNDANTITTQFLSWLSDNEDRPFFAFLNYFDAHALYLPPPGYETRFGPKSEYLYDWGSRVRDFDAEQMAGFERAYDSCIRYVDDHIEKIVDHLRETGEFDNTLIVVIGDHGEHFMEHGLLSHANSLYSPTVRVPLLLSFPAQIKQSRRIDQFVSLRDIGATILDLSGTQPLEPFPGHSLAKLWSDASDNGLPELSPVLSDLRPAGGKELKPDFWPISRGDMKSLVRDGKHFILNGDDVAELYDLRNDPNGLDNIIDTEAGRNLEPQFRAELRTILGK